MVVRNVSIEPEHWTWLEKNSISLSKYLRNRINEDMAKETELPTLQDDIKKEQRRKLENAKRLIAEEDAELSRTIDFENAEKQKKRKHL